MFSSTPEVSPFYLRSSSRFQLRASASPHTVPVLEADCAGARPDSTEVCHEVAECDWAAGAHGAEEQPTVLRCCHM